MLSTIKTNIVVPLLARGGTIAATWLIVNYGVDADLAKQIGLGFTAAGLVIADLMIGYVNRKQVR